MRRLLTTTFAVAATLIVAGPAHAVGGNYVFDGGTPKQHAQVRAALDASSFDWGVVRSRVVIHIAPTPRSYAYRGHIVLDARLVDSGHYGWAFIQHEYAHQVDFFLFGPQTRERLGRLLGGTDWYQANGRGHHHEYGAERFASTLAWAYWPSGKNALRPRTAHDESAAMAPEKFRALVAGLLRAPRYASR
jgi:hypothetical protein